jgi:hypothetical protein
MGACEVRQDGCVGVCAWVCVSGLCVGGCVWVGCFGCVCGVYVSGCLSGCV